MSNKIKIILAIFITFIVISLGYLIYQQIYRSDKIVITLNLVPHDAKITLNNKSYSGDIIYIKPGKYDVAISKDGFETVKESYQFSEADEINIGLIPESDEAKKWAENNSDKYSELSNIIALKTESDGKKFLEDNPIAAKLPYKNYLFSIGYKFDSNDITNKSIVITITSSEQYRQSAINQINDWGYDLADFNYEIINFNNPFKI